MRFARSLSLALALAASISWATAEPSGSRGASAADDRRIVAIGDIHGAFESFREILAEAELINRRGHWIGEDAILVQTGDFLDRGDEPIEIALFLMKLQKEAQRAGGEVIVLLGNHETSNLVGNRRDVSDGAYAARIDAKSSRRRTSECRTWAKIVGPLSELEPQALRRRCQEVLQLGEVEYVAALEARSKLGRWLRQLPSVVEVHDIVFVHGGLTADVAALGTAEIDRRIQSLITTFDTARIELIVSNIAVSTTMLRQLLGGLLSFDPDRLSPAMEEVLGFDDWLLAREDSPQWFRGYAQWTEDEGLERMPPILESLGARAIVAGHTPQRSKSITPRFGSRVFLIDTGMLASVYRGRASALEIQGESFTAIYVGERVPLPAPPSG